MERIVQLRDSEYESLVKKATLNEAQILSEAQKLWKEQGAARIDISFQLVGERYDADESIDCCGYVFNKDDRFCLPLDFRKRCAEIIRIWTQTCVNHYYGEPMDVINRYKRKEKNFNKLYRLIWLIAVSGWVVASILMLK